MHFHSVTSTLRRHCFSMQQQLLPNAFAALAFSDTKVAYACKVARQHLRAMLRHQQHLIGIADELGKAFTDKAFGAAVA